jgi:IS5 family transposase
MDIMNYGLREKYEQLKRFGDRLSDMKDIIQWDRIKPLLPDFYNNDTEKDGRPNFDPVFMVKIMFLQSLYGLVDEAMEIELYSNIRFMNFLDYPESVPDARAIWLFRERMANGHKDKKIWKEIWKQFQKKGITIRNGTIQDATFIESDPGHGKGKKGGEIIPIDPESPEITSGKENPEMSKKELKAAKRIEKEQKKKEREEERRNAKTRRSKDGSWAVKNRKAHFGYKLHTLQGVENDMIANYSTTTASMHDSQIELSIPGVVNYKDKGYFGVSGRGIDATMDRSLKGYKLPVESIRRNMRITRKRSRGERPYSVMKTIFHGGHIFVTTIPRVRLKCMFLCLGHNLMCMIRMEKKEMIA